MSAPRVVVMGVASCGKSAVGRALAEAEGLAFVEGDDFHSPESVRKMAAGIPLADADRQGWLAALGTLLQASGGGVVLSCSALKRAYRNQLRAACPEVTFVFLDVDVATARRRIADRPGHFFPPSLLDDQFARLESPVGEAGVLHVQAGDPVARLQQQASSWLRSHVAAT